jgi:quercetin dioxygenase-like cupin family protein
MSISDFATMSQQAGGGEILGALGPRIQRLTALSDEDDGYCLIRSTFPAGVVVPIHSHADRETFYILDGELACGGIDRWFRLADRDVFDVPGALRHGFRNLSGAPASLLFVTTMRMAGFFRDIGRPAATAPRGPPTPAGLQRFSEIAHRYGPWLGSLADNAAVGISLG